jgi:hypothetical protein
MIKETSETSRGSSELRGAKEQPCAVFESQFRELRPERFWAGKVTVADDSVDLSRLKEAIGQVAKTTGVTFSGFLRESPQGIVYEISRYPRRAFGPVASIETYEENLEKLAVGLREQGISARSAAVELPERQVFRVVVGLEEGYFNHEKGTLLDKVRAKTTPGCEPDEVREVMVLFERAGVAESVACLASQPCATRAEIIKILEAADLAKHHSLSEIRALTSETVELASVQILAAGPWGKYEEAAALITGDPEYLDAVKHVAAVFHQARIAVEEIGPDGGAAHMVEIVAYCPDPDKN